MRRFLSTAIAFALMLSLTGSASAADPKKKKGDEMSALFAKLDANGDKKISKEEFAAFHGLKDPKKEGKEPKGVATAKDEWFKKLDSNGDGFVSSEEFAKIKEVIAGSRKKKAK